MGNLHKKKCIACSGDTPALSETEIITFNKQINNWNSIKNQDGIFMLSKYFKFKNFEESWVFINKTSTIAENEGHHPDISFGWGYTNITIFTHAVQGLTESDFILAAKIDQISA